MLDDIKICKLTSGELVIAEVSEEPTNCEVLNFKGPMHVAFVRTNDPQKLGMQLMPYLPFIGEKDSIAIQKTGVLCWLENYPEEIVREYQTATSGIVVPPPGAQVPPGPGLKLVK